MSTQMSHHAVLKRAGSAVSLTSRQQFTVLDRMLTLALEPLAAETEAYLEWVAEILETTVKSRRGNAGEMMHACAAALTGAPGALELLFGSGLDRGHAFALLSHVRGMHYRARYASTRIAAGCGDLAPHHRTLHECRATLGGSDRMQPALATSAYWHDQATAWRNQIVDHYVRFLFKGAAGMSRASGGRVELDPTFHDAWMAAASAVNRFRSDQGVFASFLGRSLKGTYRIAASNALGLAAPGARVKSEAALQTTDLESAIELADHAHAPMAADPLIMRAIMAVARDPDVRALLMIGDVNPVEAMASIGVGPCGVRESTS